MGLSRIGLAVGGLSGYTAGGWLLDLSRALRTPQLPWLVLAGIGMLTWTMLALTFNRHRGGQNYWPVPCHTTRHAGPHRAVREVEVMTSGACRGD
jgi:hypothetical protein